MKNQWIERDDLEAVAIQIIYQMKDCTGVFRDYENHFYIGKVPPEHYGKIQTLFFSDWFNRANEQAIKSKELFYSGMNIIPLSRLPDEILNIVLERRRFTEHPNSPEYILQTIIKALEEKDEIKAGLSAPPASQPNQEAQPNQERTDAAEQTPAASSSIDWESMEKDLSNIFGRGATGRKRMIMRDKYGLNDEKIYEYENPGYSWNDLDAEEKHRQNVTIFITIQKAREKSSQF